MVREVAGALAGVHSLGLYHRRINPDTVIITPTGNVKIVGLMIEAALRPAGSTRRARCRHPRTGRRHRPRPAAVRLPGLPLARRTRRTACRMRRCWAGAGPRRARSGPASRRPWTRSATRSSVTRRGTDCRPSRSAADVVTALTKVLGSADASADLERRLRQPVPLVGGRGEHVDPTIPAARDRGVSPGWTQLHRSPRCSSSPGRPSPRRPVPAATVRPPTETRSVTVDRMARSLRSAPFDPSTSSGPASSGRSGVFGSGHLSAYAPALDRAVADPGRAAGHRRRGLRAGAGPADLHRRPAGQVVGRALGRRYGRRRAAHPARFEIAGAREFDPQGDPPHEENPDQVRLAYDRNPATRWRTVRYRGSPKLGNIKRGCRPGAGPGAAAAGARGRVVAQRIRHRRRVPGAEGRPAQVDKPPMGSDARWRTVAKQSKAGRHRNADSGPAGDHPLCPAVPHLTAEGGEGLPGRYL